MFVIVPVHVVACSVFCNLHSLSGIEMLLVSKCLAACTFCIYCVLVGFWPHKHICTDVCMKKQQQSDLLSKCQLDFKAESKVGVILS